MNSNQKRKNEEKKRKNVGACVKIEENIVCAKKITFRIFLHVVMKVVNI